MADTETTGGTDDQAQHTLDEHRECMRVVGEVEACLDRHPDAAGSWLAALREVLPRLEQTLSEHFSEEEGHLYRDLPAAQPRFADRLSALCAEHALILKQTREAIALTRRLEGAEVHELREINGRVQLLVATIRRHEAEENEIVLRAYWHDVGAGD